MTLFRSAVVLCLLAGLISPLHSQVTSKPKTHTGPANHSGCPDKAGPTCVDLCVLAAQMAIKDDSKQPIALEGPKNHKFSLAAHDDIQLLPGAEIVWTCSKKGFMITSVHKVWKPDSATNNPAPGAPDFPFEPNPAPYIGHIQKAGTLLHSGAAVCSALNQWYEYEFRIIDDPKTDSHKGPAIDPHFIVTGGSGTRVGRWPCPQPDHGSKPAKPPVKSKQ